MNIKSSVMVVILTFISVISFAQQQRISLDANNARYPDERLITAGQPSERDYAKLKENGITTVINLRPLKENAAFDGASVAKKYGIKYLYLPIEGSRGITKGNAKILDQALMTKDEKIFIHCSSGNRVGALLALQKFYFEGKTAIEAFEYGKKSGMTSLATHVLTELSRSEIDG